MAENKLAMYIRLSKEDLDVGLTPEKFESNSVTHQRDLLMEYYNTHEDLQAYELVEFVDDGISGTGFERPQFEAMLRLVRMGEVKCILVKDLSRFGRNYLEVGNYLDMILPLYGTRFISVTDNFDTDGFKGSTGGMDIALRNLINGLYSADLSKKVRSAMRTRNRRGEYGGGAAFYGYQLDPQNKKHLVVDENVRHIIEMIYRDCLSGLTQRQIAQKLNRMGIPSPSTYKRQSGRVFNGRMTESDPVWIQAVIRRILTDERYTGKMISFTREPERVGSRRRIPVPREDWIVVQNTHEAIISDDVFMKVQAALKSRQRGGGTTSGGYKKTNCFVCGYCGRRLQKHIGSADVYLCCPKADTVKGIPCERIRASQSILKSTVLELLRKNKAVMLRSSLPNGFSSEADLAHIREDKKRATGELSRITARKALLYEKYRSGKLSKEGYLNTQKAEEELRRKNELIISNCDQEEQRLMAEKAILKASASIEAEPLSDDSENHVYDLIHSVKVYEEDCIEVQFAFQDWVEKAVISSRTTNN